MTGAATHRDRVEAPVEVEFTTRIGGNRAKATDAATLRCAPSHEVDHDATGQSTRVLAKSFIGRADELGQQGQCLVGVIAQRVGEGILIEHADLGRDVFERTVLFERST